MKINELASEIKKTIKALKTHAVMSNTILRIEAEHYEETAYNNLKELERKAITVEQLNKPIKPSLIQRSDFNATGICPNCGNSLMKVYHRKHCGECSQALDWEEREGE